jgi:chaperone protein EcpD
MLQMLLRHAVGMITLILAIGVHSAHAGIAAPARVLFVGGKSEMVLKVANTGTRPSLVQAWIDTGDADADPSTLRSPFLIAPAVVRIEADATQSLRILLVPDGDPLPQDVESRFYLNLLDIPPDVQPTGESSMLNLAVHYRMPLIYRPKALGAAVGQVAAAAPRLQWRAWGDRTGWQIEVHNPTPYHVSIRRLSVQDAVGGPVHAFQGGEVLPGTSSRLQPLEEAQTQAGTGPWTMHYTLADELGYDIDGSTVVTHP